MAKNNLGLLYDSYPTALANGQTAYVELPVADGILGIQLRWADGTSSATITLESTNLSPNGPHPVASDSTTAGDWNDEGVTLVGPTASATRGSSTNLGNLGMARYRLKIVAAADTKLQVIANWKE